MAVFSLGTGPRPVAAGERAGANDVRDFFLNFNFSKNANFSKTSLGRSSLGVWVASRRVLVSTSPSMDGQGGLSPASKIVFRPVLERSGLEKSGRDPDPVDGKS